MNGGGILRLGRLLLLTLLIGYLSIQAHEAGHWAVLRVVGSQRTVMGFSRELRLNAELNRALESGRTLEETLRELSEQRSTAESVAVLLGAFVVQFGLIALGFFLLTTADGRPPTAVTRGIGGRPSAVGGHLVREAGLLLVLFNSLRVVGYLLRYLQGQPTRGDEHMLALHLGVPEYAVTLPLGLAFAVALLAALREMQRLPTGTLLGWMVLFVGWGLLQGLPRIDDFVWQQMEQGHPLFQPMFGMALPVWVMNGLALLALAIVLTRGRRR